MKIAIFQYDIVWGDKTRNLELVERCMADMEDDVDVLLLPEMFSTAFTVDDVSELAESGCGSTMQAVESLARRHGCAVCGSFMAEEHGKFFNRAFFVTESGERYFYDKRHLFSMGGEGKCFSAGNRNVVVKYKGWNISLQICYDLRFPVWSRNVGGEYDLLIYMANWPTVRIAAWDTLLKARAIENLSYVCGVNRVGKDGSGFDHNGHSCVISPKGETVLAFGDGEVALKVCEIDLDSLQRFRSKFPAWRDADEFDVKTIV